MDSSSTSSRQLKRPRSTTPVVASKGDPSPPRKKTKTNKKIKKTKSKTRSGSSMGNIMETTTAGSGATTSTSSTLAPKPNKPPRESHTASAQGQMMAQMLSTFSKVEQSRFEAFQRSRLAHSHVADWTADCLSHRWNLCVVDNNSNHNNNNNNNNNNNAQGRRRLQDLVAVGQAPEITLVVAVLAKIYAQRIVQTAVKMRHEQQQQQQQQQSAMESSSSATAASSSSSSSSHTPLSVHELRAAWHERQQLGLDPGFFLQAADEQQSGSTTTAATPCSTRQYHQLFATARLAALQAQEQYDAYVLIKEQEKQQEQQESAQEKNEAKQDEGKKAETAEKNNEAMDVTD